MWFRKKKPAKSAHPDLFCEMEEMFGNVRYRTSDAKILAVRKGRGLSDWEEEYLMKSKRGRYFLQTHRYFASDTRYNHVFSYTKEQAIRCYNGMPDKRVEFEVAFGMKIVDA